MAPRRSAQKPRKKARKEAPDQGSGLGDYVFGPSDEAKARVAELRERWGTLQAWGVREKLPFTREQQRSVEDFLAAWERAPDPTNITAVTADITAMERDAEEFDQKRGGRFKATPIQTSFDIEDSSRAQQAAVTVDHAAKEVSAVVKTAANDIAKQTGLIMPLLLGVGATVAVIGLVVAIKSRPMWAYV